MDKTPRLNISIGIPCFNEEENIGKLLATLEKQELHKVSIHEVIVITSGCTDNTVAVAELWQNKLPRFQIINEPRRSGKASAINSFLKIAKEEVCVLLSGDILLTPHCLEKLCLPFEDKMVGLTGAHPQPLNKKTHFIGFCVHVLWELHHEIALQSPKCGEAIAFRKTFETIAKESPVDEASIEEQIRKNSLSLVYVPEAMIYNKGPDTIIEFVRQRRRINAGHLWLKKNTGYQVSTTKYSRVIGLFLRKFRFNAKQSFWLLGLAILEILSKILAWIDITMRKKSYTVWRPIQSSKKL